MQLEIWSDVACPFCLIGKRHLDDALASFPHAEAVEIRWRSFQLAPDMPREVHGTQLEHLARKYRLTPEQAAQAQENVTAMAAQSGVEVHLDRVRLVNTLDAHRLIQFATARHPEAVDAVVTALFSGYFITGENLADHTTLARLAATAGLDPDEVSATLADEDAFAAEVLSDRAQAEQFGMNAVPAFVLERRFALTGAQPPEVMLQGLQRAWDLRDGAAA